LSNPVSVTVTLPLADILCCILTSGAVIPLHPTIGAIIPGAMTYWTFRTGRNKVI